MLLPWIHMAQDFHHTGEVIDNDSKSVSPVSPGYTIPNEETYPNMWRARMLAWDICERILACLYSDYLPKKTWKADFSLNTWSLIEVKCSGRWKTVISRPQLHQLFTIKAVSSYAMVFYTTETGEWITKVYNDWIDNWFDKDSFLEASMIFKEIYILPRTSIDDWWESNTKTTKVIRPRDPNKPRVINQRMSPKNAKDIFNKYPWSDKTEFSFIDQGYNTHVYVIWEHPFHRERSSM